MVYNIQFSHYSESSVQYTKALHNCNGCYKFAALNGNNLARAIFFGVEVVVVQARQGIGWRNQFLGIDFWAP